MPTNDKDLQDRLKKLNDKGNVLSDKELNERVARLNNRNINTLDLATANKRSSPKSELQQELDLAFTSLQLRKLELTSRFGQEKVQRDAELKKYKPGTPEYLLTQQRNKKMDDAAKMMLSHVSDHLSDAKVDIVQKPIQQHMERQIVEIQKKRNQQEIQRLEKNTAELQQMVNQRKQASTKPTPPAENKRATLATRHEKSSEKTTSMLDQMNAKVKTAEQTLATFESLKQAVAPNTNTTSTASNNVAKTPTPKPGKVTTKNEDDKVTQNTKQESKSELHRPLLVKGGRAVGYGVGVVTEAVAGAVASIIKTAVMGAWDLAMAAADKLASLTKSSNELAAGKTAAEVEMIDMKNTPAPAPSTALQPKPSASSAKENEGPSMYVKTTEAIGGVVGWGVQTALDGGIGLAAFALQAAAKLYEAVTTDNKEQATKQHAQGKEPNLDASNHSKSAGRSAMTCAAAAGVKPIDKSSPAPDFNSSPSIKAGK